MKKGSSVSVFEWTGLGFSCRVSVDRVRLQNVKSIVGSSEKGTSTMVRRIIRV